MRHTLTLLAACALHPAQAQSITSYTTADGLPSNNINDVAVAPGNILWAATQQGVARFDGSSFTVHNTTTHPGLADDDIQAIAVTANGDVWAGTDFGVSVFDGASYTTWTTADGLSDDLVRNIKQAPNGDVWIATINGATRYSNGTFTPFRAPEIPFGGTTHIAFDANGDVWLGSGLSGVIVYDGTSFRHISEADGLISDRVRSIAFDNAGNKWIGTSDGISVLDASDQIVGHHTRPFTLPAPDTLNPVTDIVITVDGDVWAGVYVDYLVTVGGVCRRIGNSWTQYEANDGLAGPNVKRLATHPNSFFASVWVATSTGLTKIQTYINSVPEVTPEVFALYPNPAASTLNIVLENTPPPGTGMEVRDARMRLLSAGPLSAVRTGIDVSAFGAGMYFVRIGDGVRPFVVER